MAMRSEVAMLQNLSASCCVCKEPIRMIKPPIQIFLSQHHQDLFDPHPPTLQLRQFEKHGALGNTN